MSPAGRLSALFARYSQRPLVHAAILTVLTCVVFGNSIFNGFHLDDFYRVVDNPGIHQISRPWVHFLDPRTMSTLDRITGYRPMLPLTLSVNYAIARENVAGYHAGNILFQVIAAWFVYLFVLELLALAAVHGVPAERARWIALVVAAVFAVHPVSGIPVNYICARDLLLMQLFWGASLWGYLRMRRLGFTVARWVFVLTAFLFSLASKADAVVAPILVFFLEVTVGNQSWRTPRPWLRGLPLASVVVLFFAFSKFVLGYVETSSVVATVDSFWTYPLTQARLHLFRYLPHFFWPFSIRQDPYEVAARGLQPEVIAGLLFVAATLTAAWIFRRRAALISFCIPAYWIMFLTTSSVVPFYHMAVDYRPYPSSPFFFIILALLALRIRWVPVRQALAVGSVAWAAVTSVLLNSSWKNENTLWRYSVERGGGALAHLNLAVSTQNLAERRNLLEEALRMSPEYLLALVNLGRTLVAQGQAEQGLEYIKKAVRLSPNNAQNHYWYALTLAELGMKREAARESGFAADDDLRNERYQYYAALEAQLIDDYPTSLKYLGRLKALAPDYPEAGFLEGFALQQAGRLEESIAVYRPFLKRQPDHVQARFNLAHALMTLDKCQEAIPEFTRVLELRPAMMAAHLHLATCYEKTGDLEKSREQKNVWEEFSHKNGPPARRP
jgi:tetratricopeptide (TPR) repeat protein